MGNNPEQRNLFSTEAARSLLDQLLTDSRLYTTSKDYKELLDFVVRLRNFAPFNAMLLQVQKPGLRYAASARDWRDRFGRTPKVGARPLLILWPFGPVALVYDVMDTEGGDTLPEDVASFFAHGPIDENQIKAFIPLVKKRGIDWCWIDAGDGNAGSIYVIKRATKEKETTQYRMCINRNHTSAVQFSTLAHELGHLFLGHLGFDKELNVPKRHWMNHAQVELEAESVAFLVCARNGVQSKSETYLKNYVEKNSTVDQIDLYQIMRAAGQVENLLGLAAQTKYDRHRKQKVMIT
ncbi:MAG: ImmA/IrrE family metallo-endopeptidase [Desulfobacterales bacterium]|nr:ImmA/IrrE family metallo-endopeptidase [Desulfobacterales bacterium]